MGWYSFGQESMDPATYLQKTGEDYAQQRYMEEPEPEYEVDYTTKLEKEPGKSKATWTPPPAVAASVKAGAIPPSAASNAGGVALMALGLALAAWVWMR